MSNELLSQTPRASSSVLHSPPSSLTREQWMVLLAAFLGWLFDGFEIGLFPVVARPALQSMSEQAGDAWVGQWMGNITALFLLGAACGGLIFGWLETGLDVSERWRSAS
ncbi:MAG: hypothetical protein L0387_14595 [Acidobacteria bacterium]|nr:hypothetical protein [Acidobacteriota bacterium]MCI0622860.1 hypothetical protein [Acidobacteriota bacterium]MCI0722889.1 hypothetical protein [Acidobacteriota bacterium]